MWLEWSGERFLNHTQCKSLLEDNDHHRELFKDSLSDKEICRDTYKEEIFKVGSKDDFTLCEAQVVLYDAV